MTTYVVTDKATGAEVYRYQADAPIEWNEFPFAGYDHTALPESEAPPAASSAVYGGRRSLTKLEFRRLFTLNERMAVDAFNAGFETNTMLSTEQKAMVRTSLEDYRIAEEINLDDPGTVQGAQIYEQLGLIAVGRAQEILNG